MSDELLSVPPPTPPPPPTGGLHRGSEEAQRCGTVAGISRCVKIAVVLAAKMMLTHADPPRTSLPLISRVSIWHTANKHPEMYICSLYGGVTYKHPEMLPEAVAAALQGG